jgi:DNA/RNA endonuclease YhcR with UshA esterase domain
MKKIILIAIMSSGYLSGFCQTKMSIDSVNNHIGESVIVCSEVHGIKSLEKVTFINLGNEYPNSPLTIVIFAKDIGNFKSSIESMYNNKNICVTGILKDYKGKTEIIITKPADIKVQ